jgi:3-hydroxyacyl-[acyl-carrier-protein] dehydratase
MSSMNIDLTLPMPAEQLIPHRPPMQLVDSLVSYSETEIRIEAVPGADCIFVGADGILAQAALVELLAQGYAAAKGYDDLVNGRPITEGYLVGVRKLALSGTARAGDRLQIRIRPVGSFEGFVVADGEIERDGEVIASGTIKLWIVGPGGNA